MTNILIFILNVIGTLLLSVEAIKLENFKKLAKNLKKYNSILNPKIVWIDEFGNRIDGENFEPEDEEITLNKAILIKIIVFFYLLSLMILYMFLHKFIRFYAIFLIAIVGSFVTWTLTILLFEGIIRFCKLLEKKLDEGIIGIVGFVMLFISYVFQYYLTLKQY